MENLTGVLQEALIARQRILESEISANEEEIHLLQMELNGIYAELDKRKGNS